MGRVRSRPIGAAAIRVAEDEADPAARDGVAPARESHAGRALADGPALADRVVIECKVLHGSRERAIAAGLRQTAACMDRYAASEGHLVIIDPAPDRSWDEKVFIAGSQAGTRCGGCEAGLG